MFSLFKKKSLLPADLNKGMLTTNIVRFKVDSSLEVPNNFICYICYKDKTYKELTSGSYSLNKEFVLDLYTRQLKNKKRLKELNADLYYINLNNFNCEFEFVDTIPVNKIKTKILFNVKVSLNINNSKLFKDFILYENNTANANETKEIVLTFIESRIKKFNLKQNLFSCNFSNETKQELFAVLYKDLNKIGISLNNLELLLFKKTRDQITEFSTGNFFAKKDINSKKDYTNNDLLININNTTKKDVDNQIQNLKDNTSNICPQCNTKMIKGSIFCHRCGYKK